MNRYDKYPVGSSSRFGFNIKPIPEQNPQLIFINESSNIQRSNSAISGKDK